ncbi:MAG: LuxR family transcriptional regulator [Sphingomonas sp.]
MVKPLSRLILNFGYLADLCTTLDELAVLLEAVARELGFEFLAMLHSISLMGSSERLIRHDTYPPGWEKLLVGRGRRVIDPVLAYSRTTTTGFPWPHFPRRFSLTRPQEEIFEQGERFGLRQGYTVPANVPGEPFGSITFATRRMRPISRERQLIVNAIGTIAFEAARRIKGLASPSPVPHLLPREVECIYWIARGQSDKEIARTLGIAHATVRTHVRRAFETLRVFTRQQLVYEALRLGVIEFDESVAYRGD